MPKINISNDMLGKAYKAFEAYNWKQKKDRVQLFDLKRWLRVVQAIEDAKPRTLNGKQPADRKGWSKALHGNNP